jgi:hypothetical protein
MRKLIGMWVAVMVVLSVQSAQALTLAKGSQFITVQLTEGTADLVNPEAFTPGYITAYSHSEMGVQAQYVKLMSDDFAFNLSGGIGFFSETDKPGTNALPGSTDQKYTQSSWQGRIGVDRVGHIGERLHVFVGPGLQVWSGKAKFETGSTSIESESTTRIGFHGRIGFHVAFNPAMGIFGQVGHYFAYAHAKDAGAEATWWPSAHDGAAGLAFTF